MDNQKFSSNDVQYSIPTPSPRKNQDMKRERRNAPLDIKYIQEKLIKFYKYSAAAEGGDLVLIIGNTGAGKSTTANYLLGLKMIENEYNDMYVIDVDGPPTFKIGHKVECETSYAKAVSRDKLGSYTLPNPWVVVDCPGFQGNRAKVEDHVIESISIELAIKKAYQIKGILIAISMYDIREARAQQLRDLMKTLIALFKDPIEMVQYSVFVITKCEMAYNKALETRIKKMTAGSLRNTVNFCKEQIEKLTRNNRPVDPDGLTTNDYDRIANYFDAVLEKQDEIVFVDPLDNGESRQLIIDRLTGIKPRRKFFKELVQGARFTIRQTDEIRPITIEDFRFGNYDKHRYRFNEAMYSLAHKGHEIINTIRQNYQ